VHNIAAHWALPGAGTHLWKITEHLPPLAILEGSPLAAHPARTLLSLMLIGCAVSCASGADKPRTVYLGGHLGPAELVSYTSTIHAADPDAVILLDSAVGSSYTRAFLAAAGVERIIPVGLFPGGTDDVQSRLKVNTAPPLAWKNNPPPELWRSLFPRADQVVACPCKPRRMLLQAACLAVALRAPLFLLPDDGGSSAELTKWLKEWQTRKLYLVGKSEFSTDDVKGLKTLRLKDEAAVFDACIDTLAAAKPVVTLVVANPEDVSEESGGMSGLAPWIAGQKRAPLVFTNEHGDDVEERVHSLVRDKRLGGVENILLVGSLTAIPVKHRPNPLADGKDALIEMEQLTPAGNEPYTFAVGRLFGDCPAVVAMQLARQRLLHEHAGPRSALIASNPGGSLPLLEVFSRNTALELKNGGYKTTSLIGKDLTGTAFRHEMARHDVILWEGHHSTLIKDYGMPDWDEPLPGSFIVLQSCLALQEAKAQPLLRRGAVGVVGSSTRTFSASGGAMSLAFFDALLYDEQSAGAALRQAKNFLLAYAILKERRLGDDAKRTGANQRAAWSFSLWGDPTLTLPTPAKPEGARSPVRHEVVGDTIVVMVPEKQLDGVHSSKYKVQMPPNARLAGLIRKDADDDNQPLVPFLFVEVHLPDAPEGKVPRLKSKLSWNHQVFCWDERRKRGYLLAEPHNLDEQELRFRVVWEEPVVSRQEE
jgi:hypothetical protein